MKNLFLLLVALAMFVSCSDIQYDGEKRLVFKTQILDGNNNPLPNSHVDIITHVDYASDSISSGKTDANGNITLIFPSPQADFHIQLSVYNDDASYMTKGIFNIENTEFIDYKFVHPNINLLKNEEVAPLNLSYNQTSNNMDLMKVSINGIYHADYEYFDNPLNNYYLPPAQLLIKKNQAFQLKYKLRNTQTNVETEYTVDLQIDNDAINYTLNY